MSLYWQQHVITVSTRYGCSALLAAQEKYFPWVLMDGNTIKGRVDSGVFKE